MNKEVLTKKVEENLNFVKEFYEEGKARDGFATMFLINTSKNEKESHVVAMFGDNEALNKRREVAFDFGVRTGVELMKKEIDSINAVFMMSEAWLSIVPEEEAKMGLSKRPSDDPNKKEVIVSAGSSKEGEVSFGMFELKRSIDLDTAKLKVGFESLKDYGSAKMESPLLKSFWDGVDFAEILQKTLPKEIETFVKTVSSEVLFSMIIRQINRIRK